MKITNVEWNEGAPKMVAPGMAILWDDGRILIHGGFRDTPVCRLFEEERVKAWAWLIQPHELAWLEDMANKHKARARG
ncbi:hypothetical protein Q8W87_05490 [Pseudomonas aeruginosa]|uniref:hypothetical protein n=1 Tax=Pseudomonas aeruginosa TaxID=287 RepID=UPI0028FE9766|nr:hypothetical protein [Pseudomonas aeruginosa]MDU0699533.1 hypothetical protein [Pseudomonas aeruginosa]HBO1194490.1 hypothetical protein [Pseudomonas aeruginosa]HBO1212439.1 hypothetical protein [Pseudomonas aeruginosa]